MTFIFVITRQDKIFDGDDGGARDDNDGAHSTPAAAKGINCVGGIAQPKRSTYF